MPRFLSLLFALTLVLGVTACDSSDPDPDPDPPAPAAPTFSIASIPVTLGDGSAGLQFAATPNASVTLVEVVITNPIGQTERFNAQNVVVLQNQSTPLQDPNIGYTRISGNWTFRFVGARTPTVTGGNFDVTTSLSVGAAAPGGPVD